MVNKLTCVHKHQETESNVAFLQLLTLGQTRWWGAREGRPIRGNSIVKIPTGFQIL